MIIVGCLLWGIGIGQFVGNTGAGTLVGLGAGFIIEYIVGRGFRSRQVWFGGGKNPPNTD